MIVWLASYPRTGSKLIRDFLHQVFGLPAFSEYGDHHSKNSGNKIGQREPVTQTLPFSGEATYNGTFEDFYLHVRQSERGFLVKTHHPPLDDSPAMVMTRDGRAALVSFYHFLRDLAQVDVTMSEVIQGEVGIGTWSSTLDEWNPLERPQTLFLRFEDLISDPDLVTEMISSFLNIPPIRKWENRLPELQQVNPLANRAANSRNISQFNVQEEDLFWECHLEWMEIMGYTEPVAAFRSSVTTPIESIPEQWFRYCETVEGVFHIPGIVDEYLPLQQRMYRYFYDRFFGHNPEADEFREAMRERKTKMRRSQKLHARRRRAA